jgi:ribosomal protein L40E
MGAVGTVEAVPDDLHQCARCGAVNQPATGGCRECAEESECKRLRERLFGGTIELELLTD